MAYQFGATLQKPNGMKLTSDELRAKIENLRRLESAIEAEALAKEQHLSKLYAERRRRHRAGDYTPSADALAYRDKYAAIIAAQPRPIHGGPAGLRAAAAEAAGHWTNKQNEAADAA